MAILPIFNLVYRAFLAFWSLVTFAVAAAFLDRVNGDIGSRYASDQLTGSAGAIIAAGVLGFLYFSAVVALLFIRPDTFLLSMIIDTSVIGFLFILSLGGTAAESVYADDFRACGRSFCSLGEGLLGVAWVYTLLLLGVLLWQVIYTLRHFGGSTETWKTPFNELISDGPSRGGLQTTSTSTRPATV